MLSVGANNKVHILAIDMDETYAEGVEFLSHSRPQQLPRKMRQRGPDGIVVADLSRTSSGGVGRKVRGVGPARVGKALPCPS